MRQCTSWREFIDLFIHTRICLFYKIYFEITGEKEPELLSQNLSVCIKVGHRVRSIEYVHETENRIVSAFSVLTKPMQSHIA